LIKEGLICVCVKSDSNYLAKITYGVWMPSIIWQNEIIIRQIYQITSQIIHTKSQKPLLTGISGAFYLKY